MRYASITERLADLGGEKWLLYSLARQMAQDVCVHAHGRLVTKGAGWL